MIDELKQIKKLYGEKMMHFCRDFFSSILEEQGLLLKFFQENFAESHLLYIDLEKNDLLSEFKSFIFDLFYKQDKEKAQASIDLPTPEELMSEAGYELFECITEEDIQKFKKYYEKREELCTFRGGRLDSCYVFFAVKKNVDEIKREDYSDPKRQDEYGTSVISIQFSRDSSHTLSIKNRYNHRVLNPDATFSNNLDNIIAGLTDSFEQTYGLKQEYRNIGVEIPKYVRANDGRWYKYNYEINNVYYCSDNIIIDNGKVKKYDKEKYIILDYMILDLEKKQIYLYDKFRESFPKTIGKIKRIVVTKKDQEKEITIYNEQDEEIKIIINNANQIIGLKSENLRYTDYGFLYMNETISTLELPSLQQAGESFLCFNKALIKLELPSLQKVGSGFLSYNDSLLTLGLPELQQAGNDFMRWNPTLQEVYLPLLQSVGDNFLRENRTLLTLELPSLELAWDYFLQGNESISSLYLPKLQQVGHSFLASNKSLTILDLPSLQKTGSNFLKSNNSLIKTNLPRLNKGSEYSDYKYKVRF